jgi:hypothetical protein
MLFTGMISVLQGETSLAEFENVMGARAFHLKRESLSLFITEMLGEMTSAPT